MENKTTIIRLSNNREIRLLWVRPAPTAQWICQASDEFLIDMQKNLNEQDSLNTRHYIN